MQDVFLQKIVLYKTGLYERSYIKQGYIKQGYIRPGRMKRRDINAAHLDWLSHRGSGPSAQAADCLLYERPALACAGIPAGGLGEEAVYSAACVRYSLRTASE